jgi:hypothetical protein
MLVLTSKTERMETMRVGVYNEAGEPLGFEDVYEPDPNDWADEYDELPYQPSVDDDHDNGIYAYPWSVGYDQDGEDEEE